MPADRARSGGGGSYPADMSEDTRDLTLPLDLAGHRATTERLVLRPYEFSDLEAMHEMHARPEVCRYIPWDLPDRTASRRRLGRYQNERLERDGDGLTLAAVEQD